MTLTISHPHQGRSATVKAAIGTFVVGALAIGGYQTVQLFNDGETTTTATTTAEVQTVASTPAIGDFARERGVIDLSPTNVVGLSGAAAVSQWAQEQGYGGLSPASLVAPPAADAASTGSALLNPQEFQAAIDRFNVERFSEALNLGPFGPAIDSTGYSTPSSGPR